MREAKTERLAIAFGSNAGMIYSDGGKQTAAYKDWSTRTFPRNDHRHSRWSALRTCRVESRQVESSLRGQQYQ